MLWKPPSFPVNCANLANAHPCFLRPSVRVPPGTTDLCNVLSTLPIGFELHPLAKPQGVEIPRLSVGVNPQSSSASPDGSAVTIPIPGDRLVRCRACKAYINPFVQWQANGTRWACSLCFTLQATPTAYCSSLDVLGQRNDVCERPELWSGHVEYVLCNAFRSEMPRPSESKKGCGTNGSDSLSRRLPKSINSLLNDGGRCQPALIFMVDVSKTSVASGLLRVSAHTIAETIRSGPLHRKDIGIGLVTFDTSVHCYSLSEPGMPKSRSSPKMIIVSDVDEVYVPLPASSMLDVSEDKAMLLEVLDALPEMFSRMPVEGSCLGAAIVLSKQALVPHGGRICMFITTPPTLGELSRFSAEGPNHCERELGTPLWREFSQTLAQDRVSVDIFVAPQQEFADVGNISALSKMTGGDLLHFPFFSEHHDASKLEFFVHQIFARETGRAAELRLRVSSGWRVSRVYGHSTLRRAGHHLVAQCHEDKVFRVVIRPEEAGRSRGRGAKKHCDPGWRGKRPYLVFQVALSSLGEDGRRRIRVYTWSAPDPARSHMESFLSVDPVVAAAISASEIASASPSEIDSVRARLQGDHQRTLQVCGPQCSEVLAPLTTRMLGMLKYIAWCGAPSGSDMRAAIHYRLEVMPVARADMFFCPWLLAVPAVCTDICEADAAGGQLKSKFKFEMPTSSLTLSRESLSSHGVFLLIDSDEMSVWIGREVTGLNVEDVWRLLRTHQARAPPVEEGCSWKYMLESMICALRYNLQHGARLRSGNVVKEGEQNEDFILRRLIEDRGPGTLPSGAEFRQSLTMPYLIR